MCVVLFPGEKYVAVLPYQYSTLISTFEIERTTFYSCEKKMLHSDARLNAMPIELIMKYIACQEQLYHPSS